MSETTPETPAPEAGGEQQPATGSEPTTEDRLAQLQADRDKWQAQSRKQEERAKANADKAKRFDELEAASKSEAEKLAERATAAEARNAALTQRAAKAEVKALAASTFADPSDAAAFLDLSEFVGDDGDIDSKGIESALADLLKRKPHLAKEAAAPSFDGGARRTADKPASMNELIRQKAAK